ncbi:hypothetical protein [Algicella marina]|uniref:Sulfotransferase family protein n=1 Tax=Algicella marina TaxID=2683284 RepID=A0A6P1T1E7_9RHOB|nr:hypothetical protein [Algicella marina]QHQ35463.1 hypothetical protein GO499_09805 [Algicella marina]
MKLLLHIGTEKTGTTSFQRWVDSNNETLRSEGVWHAQTIALPDNRALAVMARDPDKPEDGFNQFNIRTPEDHANFVRNRSGALKKDVAEAKAAGMRVYLISNEHLQSRLFSQQMVDRVAEIVKRHFDEIEVVCFLRPQLDTAISLASTGARVGNRISIKQFEGLQAQGHYYNFKDLLDRWANAFGAENVTPVAFKRNKNTVEFFRRKLGLERTDYQPEVRLNAALDYRAVALSNQLNLPRFFDDGSLNPNRQFFMEEIPFEKPLTLSRHAAQRIHERFQPLNAEIAARWASITEEDLTPDWERYPEQGTIEQLDECDLGPALRYVVQKFNADLALARAQTDIQKARLALRNREFKAVKWQVAQADKKIQAAAAFEPVKERACEMLQEISKLQESVAERQAQRQNRKEKPEAKAGGGFSLSRLLGKEK